MIRPTKLGKGGFGGEGFDDDMEVCKDVLKLEVKAQTNVIIVAIRMMSL